MQAFENLQKLVAQYGFAIDISSPRTLQQSISYVRIELGYLDRRSPPSSPIMGRDGGGEEDANLKREKKVDQLFRILDRHDRGFISMRDWKRMARTLARGEAPEAESRGVPLRCHR